MVRIAAHHRDQAWPGTLAWASQLLKHHLRPRDFSRFWPSAALTPPIVTRVKQGAVASQAVCEAGNKGYKLCV